MSAILLPPLVVLHFDNNDMGSVLYNIFGINYIKIDVIKVKIQPVESVFDVIDIKIGFIELTLGLL